MTKLSLHHSDENPSLSIHLREGQYCTFGSSAAADYSIRADGVEPVHCRIGCQPSGGYIECLNVFGSISVNESKKGRSRLSNGDTLRIGTVELKVELPETEKKMASFSVEFDAEDTPTTKVVDSFDLDDDQDTNEKMDSAVEPNPRPSVASDDFTTTPEETDSTDSQVVTVSQSKRESQGESTDEPATPAPEPQPSVAEGQQPDIESQRPDVKVDEPVLRKSKKDDSKPQFEFDSSEPGEFEISQKEFAELSEPDAEHVTMGAVDLENELVDSAQSIMSGLSPLGVPPPPEEDESGEVLEGASFTGKYWRWNGEQAIEGIQRLIDSENGIRVFRCEVNQISVDEFEEISMERMVENQPAVFLLSSLDLTSLEKLVRQKRWEDRIGHPQAVTMFLTFLPKRMLREFFDSISACVLIHENDVELVRAKKNI